MKKISILAAGLGLFTSACGGGGGTDSLELVFEQLPVLGTNYVYEGWLITPDGPVSTGRFADDAPLNFKVDSDITDASTTFVLTIEAAEGDDRAPSDAHILAGDLDDVGSAELSTTHMAALGADFSSATGEFILATPSTVDDTDGVQGIWFLAPGPVLQPSLTLPELPAGWIYEGWVVGDDGPVSTGRFLTPVGVDSDGAGPTAGEEGTPQFPGQDFIEPPVSLVGLTAVISVEPIDDDPEPFALKPLITATIADQADLQSMSNEASATLPSGTLDLR